MAACNIDFTVPGDYTKAQVRKRFEDERENGIYMHGHDPYNGTWSTISSVVFKDKIFDDYDEAYEYCLDNAEKWDYAIAVKTKNDKGELVWLVAGWAAE